MYEKAKKIFMRIDTHVHFWNYNKQRDTWVTDDMQMLQQDYLPDSILPLLRENIIDGVVAVQADQSMTETLFIKELATRYPQIKGVIGWINLQIEDIEKELAEYRQYPIIKGWRHIVQAEPTGFLMKEDVVRGVRLLGQCNYTYDILVGHSQMTEVLDFVNKLPEQKLVLDHCGKPGIKNRGIKEWAQSIKELAKYKHVYCKLSGLLTEADGEGLCIY